MAVTFLQQKKNQQYLIAAFLATLLITSFVVWFGFFRKEAPSSVIISRISPKLTIDYPLLQDPLLEGMILFEKIKPLEAEPGRENPFLPY